MRVRDQAILVGVLVAMLAVISAVIFASPVLRVMFWLPLIFYLPGHAILCAVFRRKRTGLAGAVFAAGLSLAVTIFCGFVLHLVGGLTPVGWMIALGVVTLGAYGAASARGGFLLFLQSRAANRPTPTSGQVAMMVCAVVIAAGAVILARQQTLAHPEFAYTELWMVPHAEDRAAITIGFKNVERASSSYDLEIMLDERTVIVRRSIQLEVGETWTSSFGLPIGSGAAHLMEARLFKDGHDHLVYRRVWLRTGPEA